MEGAVDQMLIALDHRGGDATGFVAIHEEGSVMQKASCDAYDFCKDRRNIPYRTRSIILHTRMATQGSPAFPENNHPVQRGSVYVVHNGHIWNDRDIFKNAKRERIGQVDSEAIAALIAKYGIMSSHKAMEEISGAAAIFAVDETRPGVIVLARGSSSPMYSYRNEAVIVAASTSDAVKRAWVALYGSAPKDKHIASVREGDAYYIDGGKVEKQTFVPDDIYGYSSYGKYKPYKSSYDYGDWGDYSEIRPGVFQYDPEKKMLVERNSDSSGIKPGDMECEHGLAIKWCDICTSDADFKKWYMDEAIEKPCGICGHMTETEPYDVDAEGETWHLCDVCAEELSLAISENDIKVRVVNSWTGDNITL